MGVIRPIFRPIGDAAPAFGPRVVRSGQSGVQTTGPHLFGAEPDYGASGSGEGGVEEGGAGTEARSDEDEAELHWATVLSWLDSAAGVQVDDRGECGGDWC